MTNRIYSNSLFGLFKEISKMKTVYQIGMIDKTETGYSTTVWMK